jgi:hypothetical protein
VASSSFSKGVNRRGQKTGKSRRDTALREVTMSERGLEDLESELSELSDSAAAARRLNARVLQSSALGW